MISSLKQDCIINGTKSIRGRICYTIYRHARCVTRGGRRKLEISVHILGKITLIVTIYGKHFSCNFKSSQEKKPTYYPTGPFYQSVLISRKLPFPEKFLVTRLHEKANNMKGYGKNKYMKGYDKNKESSYLKYWNENILYGWLMWMKNYL